MSLLLATLSSHLRVFTSHSNQHKGMNFALFQVIFLLYRGFFRTNEAKWREFEMTMALELFSRVTGYAPNHSPGGAALESQWWGVLMCNRVAAGGLYLNARAELDHTLKEVSGCLSPVHVISRPCAKTFFILAGSANAGPVSGGYGWALRRGVCPTTHHLPATS